MKKILLSIFLIGALVSSCDMDYIPAGTTDIDDITNFDDVTMLRNQLYSSLRSATGGSYIAVPDLMADQFVGSLDNGNRNGQIANNLFNTSTSEFESLWNACYSRIATTNFFMMKTDSLLKVNTAAMEAGTTEKFTADELIEINRYMGEAKFVRAYTYFYLFDHFCQHYTADKAQTPALGLPLVKSFNPSKDYHTYCGRSTMEETLTFINNDLTDAFNALSEYENLYDSSNATPNAVYLNSYTVAAMQARVALYTEQWKTAAEKAEYVTESGLFPLVSTTTAYDAMWKTDEASELLFVPFASESEKYVSSVYDYYNNLQAANNIDYLPCANVLSSYWKNDIRTKENVGLYGVLMQGSYMGAPRFTKWWGNSRLGTGSVNRPHPFRSAEMYLTLAEAKFNLEDETGALTSFNDLLKARCGGTINASGATLLTLIREERGTELIGEGFRLSDLKRWGMGFIRDTDYSVYDLVLKNTSSISSMLNPVAKAVSYDANDPRYTWPIPAAEMDINPQLAGQQNPGY